MLTDSNTRLFKPLKGSMFPKLLHAAVHATPPAPGPICQADITLAS